MNLLADGDAYHLSGATFLGAGKTTADDGINTAASYTVKATDDGVTWTPNVHWTVAAGGSVDVTVTCPSALTPRLTTPGLSIGQALQEAKRELGLAHPELIDVLLGWSLMEDPGLIIDP